MFWTFEKISAVFDHRVSTFFSPLSSCRFTNSCTTFMPLSAILTYGSDDLTLCKSGGPLPRGFPSPSPQISTDRLQAFWLLIFTIKTCFKEKWSPHLVRKVTWSLFCRKHFASRHILHCVYMEFSSSNFSCFSYLYLDLIRVLGWNTGKKWKTPLYVK